MWRTIEKIFYIFRGKIDYLNWTIRVLGSPPCPISHIALDSGQPTCYLLSICFDWWKSVWELSTILLNPFKLNIVNLDIIVLAPPPSQRRVLIGAFDYDEETCTVIYLIKVKMSIFFFSWIFRLKNRRKADYISQIAIVLYNFFFTSLRFTIKKGGKKPMKKVIFSFVPKNGKEKQTSPIQHNNPI